MRENIESLGVVLNLKKTYLKPNYNPIRNCLWKFRVQSTLCHNNVPNMDISVPNSDPTNFGCRLPLKCMKINRNGRTIYHFPQKQKKKQNNISLGCWCSAKNKNVNMDS